MVIASNGMLRPISVLDHNMVEYATENVLNGNFWTGKTPREFYDYYEDSYQEKEINEESYFKCDTLVQFIDFCKDSGYHNERDFYEMTEISFENVEGNWFKIVDNDLNILSEDDIL